MKTGPLLLKIFDSPISMDSCIVHWWNIIACIGHYLPLAWRVRQRQNDGWWGRNSGCGDVTVGVSETGGGPAIKIGIMMKSPGNCSSLNPHPLLSLTCVSLYKVRGPQVLKLAWRSGSKQNQGWCLFLSSCASCPLHHYRHLPLHQEKISFDHCIKGSWSHETML